MEPLPPAPQALPPTIHSLTYDGNLKILTKIWMLNILLSILTLGIYNFWGKTKLRRYVARGFILNHERFEYTGRPKELLKGFFVVAGILFLLGLLSTALNAYTGKKTGDSSFGIAYALLWYYGWFASMRYRMSRTTWKGIRGALDKKYAGKYMTRKLMCSFCNIFTLGLYVARADRKMWNLVMQAASFGNQPMSFTPLKDHKLVSTNVVTLLLVPLTFGLSRLWYVGVLLNYKLSGIGVGGLVTEASFSGKQHTGFVLKNWLLMTVTFGIARPYIIHRKMHYLASHVTFNGIPDTNFILQSLEKVGETGEGLDDVLGIDIGFI